MYKINLLILLVCSSFVCAIAQEDYTYISDRKFFFPNDLIGYDFRPNYMEIPNETEADLEPGEYSFGISQSNLYVDGGEIKGVYSVNNINPTEYGYKLLLMNARNPRIQGHLKVILNKYAQVEALVFKKSKQDAEMIFFQATMGENLYVKEKEYFTDRYDLQVEEQDSIWGQKLMPFMRIHKDQGGVQERLQISDSTSIEFVEKITIIEKKKKRRKRKKNKNKDIEMESDSTIVETLAETDLSSLEADPGAFPPIDTSSNMEAAINEKQKEDVKIKIVKEYFIHVRTILTFEDGTTEDKVEEIPIKKKFTLYETETNGDPTVAPFQLEISPKKGDPIIMHLTKKQTVSAIDIKGKKYLMRGH